MECKPPRSCFQHIPPRDKLLAALLFTFAASSLQTPLAAGVACASGALLLYFSAVPFSTITKRCITINVFFLFLWLFLPLTLNAPPYGHRIFSVGPFSFVTPGLWLALIITLKGNAIAFVLLALPGTVSIQENAQALLSLKVPRKLVTLLILTANNIESSSSEYTRIYTAARLRGFSPRTSIRAYTTQASLLGNLLIRAWQRSQRVEIAMRLRSFTGHFPLIAPQSDNPVSKKTTQMGIHTLFKANSILYIFGILYIILLMIYDRTLAPGTF